MGGLLGIVDSALKLGTSVVDRMNLKDHQKYVDRVRAAKLAVMEEDGKADGVRSDRKLEDLMATLEIELSTMNLAIASGVADSK